MVACAGSLLKGTVRDDVSHADAHARTAAALSTAGGHLSFGHLLRNTVHLSLVMSFKLLASHICTCRLPWPEGTVIFDVAPADAHAVTASALKAAGAHVPRACLLRRVVADYAASPSFQNALAAGGLRGDRLSVWAIQVSEVCCAAL